jgi:hypothetical protein
VQFPVPKEDQGETCGAQSCQRTKMIIAVSTATIRVRALVFSIVDNILGESKLSPPATVNIPSHFEFSNRRAFTEPSGVYVKSHAGG